METIQPSTLILFLAALFAAFLVKPANAAQMMTRTLKERPAIVIAAFGTSTKAQITYDAFTEQLKKTFPDHEIMWAFTSEVIRERVNARRVKKGEGERLLSLQEALARLEAEGHRKVVVQPLHIFPGSEYNDVVAKAQNFPGLRVELGETLLQRWDVLREVVELLSKDFLSDEEGANVLVTHGTPSTHIGSNITLLGLNHHLLSHYPNVYMGCVDGAITKEEALNRANAHKGGKVRFIPLMYVAGDHIMNDIMGEDGRESWKADVEAAGKKVDVPTVDVAGEKYFRGLGFLPEVNEIFIREIGRSLKRL